MDAASRRQLNAICCVKTCVKKLLLQFALASLLVGHVVAQTFAVVVRLPLYSKPNAAVTEFRNTLYGPTWSGGNSVRGSLFSINSDGTGFAILHNFSNIYNNTNSDGAYPDGALVLSGGTLYGSTTSGGYFGGGTIFTIDTNGMNFSVLHHFEGADGTGPIGGLILCTNTLYGVAGSGGTNGYGVIFKVRPDGSDFTVLHHFADVHQDSNGSFTNAEGIYPSGLLV